VPNSAVDSRPFIKIAAGVAVSCRHGDYWAARSGEKLDGSSNAFASGVFAQAKPGPLPTYSEAAKHIKGSPPYNQCDRKSA